MDVDELRRFATRVWEQRTRRPYPVIPPDADRARRVFGMDLRELASEARDNEGVVQTTSGALVYSNPVSLAFRVLADDQHLRLASSGGFPSRLSLRVNAQRLADLQETDGSWRYPVRVPRYGVEPGWVSAMAQMLGAAAMARASAFEPETDWGTRASRAVRFGLQPWEQGGCTQYGRSGRPFLEECPGGVLSPLPFVLNGAAFALLGLHDFAWTSGDEAALRVAAAGADRLHGALFRWDTGSWTKYDLTSPAPASPDYHLLHSSLAEALGYQFPGTNWSVAAARWRRYGDTRGGTWRALEQLGVARLSGG